MDTELTVYRLRNKTTGLFVKRSNGKTIWHTPGAAKNAWHAEFSNWRDRKSFNDQTEWECVPYKLVPVQP